MSYCCCSLAGTAACRSCSNRIRAMSNEELAKLIAENIDCCVCMAIHHAEDNCCPTASGKACPDMWLDWLKKEAET